MYIHKHAYVHTHTYVHKHAHIDTKNETVINILSKHVRTGFGATFCDEEKNKIWSLPSTDLQSVLFKGMNTIKTMKENTDRFDYGKVKNLSSTKENYIKFFTWWKTSLHITLDNNV